MSSDLDDDLIHRFLFNESDIRGEIITLTRSYQDACATQDISKDILPLYGEFLTGVCMVSEILKFDGLVTLQARGDGPIPVIMSEIASNGDVRGIVSTGNDSNTVLHSDMNTLLPLGELIGKGVLTLTLDPTKGKRYQGIVPLDQKDLATCLQHYFEQSEQVPTHIVLFANDEKCGGIFLQCLPPQKVMDDDIRQEQWQTTMQLLNTINENEFFNVSHETLLHRLFHEMQCQIFEPKKITFNCNCSRKRSEKALHSLGEKDLLDLVAEKKTIDIDCQFCGVQYKFDEEDIRTLLNSDKKLH